MPRPEHLIVVAGTGTEVGKTWVAARLLETWRAAGRGVAARKPVQSFEAGEVTDAEILAVAAAASPSEVCLPHRWYEVPMAPPMAATALGRDPFTVRDLVDELHWPPDADIGLVESAGGVRSPIADDGDTVTLLESLGADGVLVVGHAGLGTINDVRMAVAAVRPTPALVFLNRFDPGVELHVLNRRWLAERDGVEIVTDVDAMAARGFDWCRRS